MTGPKEAYVMGFVYETGVIVCFSPGEWGTLRLDSAAVARSVLEALGFRYDHDTRWFR